MNIYIAGRFIRRAELSGYASELRALGHTCDPRWLVEGAHEWDNAGMGGREFAEDDARDVYASDLVVSFTETPRDTFSEAMVRQALAYPIGDPGLHTYEIYSLAEATEALNKMAGLAARGGRHVEFGMALAQGKRLFVVGPPENVFHLLPDVEIFSTWPEALAHIGQA